MTEPGVFVLADRAIADVVDQIKDDQWDIKLPDWFQIGTSQDRDQLTLKDIINYHAYDDAWVPDVLAGKTKEDVGAKYDGDLLGADPKANFRAIATKAIQAVQNIDNLDKPVHLSYGDYPARVYLQHITCFRGFRIYELSRLIGISTTMPKALVQGMWDQIEPVAEEWRGMGVFKPAITPPADADLQTKLLNLSGRSAS